MSVGVSVSSEILDAEGPEDFAASPEFFIDAFEDAESELAVTFDGDDTSVWEAMVGVALEFDAFFEIDEEKFDFIGAEVQGEIGDENVEQC